MPSAKNKVQPQKNSHEHELDSKGVYQLANGTWAFRFCKSVNGKNRIFDIYDKTDDFVVIFDCVCDVEIFTDAEDSFYQIKTKKQTQAYTTTALCTAEKGKSGEVLSSILGKLFLIKAASDPQRKVKVAVVANVGFKHKQKEYLFLILLMFICRIFQSNQIDP